MEKIKFFIEKIFVVKFLPYTFTRKGKDPDLDPYL
jgi:hypothetical protein